MSDDRDATGDDLEPALEPRVPRRRWPRIRWWLARAGAVLGAGLLILASVVLFRTCRLESRQPRVDPAEPLAIPLEQAAERLSRAVRIPTVSSDHGPADPELFLALHRLLETSFPRVHATLGRELVGPSSLLYTWPGSDPSARPVILAAHMDVVPADPADADAWIHPPFSGVIADGHIWGRGTLDDKMSVLGILEAAEALLAEGFQPRRTLYLAFGHDEEITSQGAMAIAKILAERGVRAELALDEGLVLTRGVMKSLDAPVAAVGIAEKGYLTVELTAHAEAGHSSMPPRRTAVGALARAVARLRAEQMPATLEGPVEPMLDYLAPEMPFIERMAMANRWLFGSIVVGLFEASPTTEALVRTTTAPTMLSAGTKDNVLPSTATATVNFRVRPGDTTDDVVAHVRRVIDDDHIEIQVGTGEQPSPVSDPEAPGFQLIQRTVRQVFTGAVVVPGLVIGGTDGRYYQPVADDVYRFAPLDLGADDLSRIHGVNERISLENYRQVILFYAQLMRNLQS